jgi:hypothetical protein
MLGWGMERCEIKTNPGTGQRCNLGTFAESAGSLSLSGVGFAIQSFRKRIFEAQLAGDDWVEAMAA